MQINTSDYLVIGSGIAGLSFAIDASAKGSVAVITKKDNTESNTNLAQGGIASVLGKGDSFALHIADTLRAGAGLCNEDAVKLLVKDGPRQIERLIKLGVRFSRERMEDGSTPLALGREGGHSKRRIAHAQDLTGREIERALVTAVLANDNIRVHENHLAVDFLLSGSGKEQRCIGAIVLDLKAGKVELFLAHEVLLCTGGLGEIYPHTTNPPIATGDGVAMAYRAGAVICNMEFIQFHPTALYHEKEHSFLISEALRGEGGMLYTASGKRFMPDYHPDAELAPRDVVARAIDAELKKSGDKCVYLSMTHLPGQKIKERFPNIFKKCMELGIDITIDPIPVVPAAHYQCGGIMTDLDARTTIPGLFAAGEVACTGVHGANRLASNSLLEAVVFSDRAAKALSSSSSGSQISVPVPGKDFPEYTFIDEVDPVVRQLQKEIKEIMWQYVGIVRTRKHIKYAIKRLKLIREEILELFRDRKINAELVQSRNMACAASLVAKSANRRLESRGLHYLAEHPEPDDGNPKKNTLIVWNREEKIIQS